MNLADLWKWIDDNGSGLQAAGTMLTAVIAIWALRSAALDSRERSRPIVIAQFRKAKNSTAVIDLVVGNVGLSVARDVEVSFDPPIVIPEDVDGRLTQYIIERYENPIPLLAPGQELENVWYSGEDRGGPDLVNVEPTGDSVTLTVKYRGNRRRAYRDEFPLHIDTVLLTTFSTSTDSFIGRIHGIHKSLVSLSKSAENIARAADYVRRDEIEEQKARTRGRAERFLARQAERSDVPELASSPEAQQPQD